MDLSFHWLLVLLSEEGLSGVVLLEAKFDLLHGKFVGRLDISFPLRGVFVDWGSIGLTSGQNFCRRLPVSGLNVLLVLKVVLVLKLPHPLEWRLGQRSLVVIALLIGALVALLKVDVAHVLFLLSLLSPPLRVPSFFQRILALLGRRGLAFHRADVRVCALLRWRSILVVLLRPLGWRLHRGLLGWRLA